ncbi:hypothetical protein KOW79_013095 [Hemibagrus wyckioides]|uniref:Uncharacterized protein n=1 Tax=Hemibagrus wyckioides TaxID=337641 RepID=A0A9D3NI86_9TELE|nr:hypothetical protein KOW79_013095 [Hemibagrus wyckioides]
MTSVSTAISTQTSLILTKTCQSTNWHVIRSSLLITSSKSDESEAVIPPPAALGLRCASQRETGCSVVSLRYQAAKRNDGAHLNQKAWTALTFKLLLNYTTV